MNQSIVLTIGQLNPILHDVFENKPYDEVLGAAQLIKLEIHLIV